MNGEPMHSLSIRLSVADAKRLDRLVEALGESKAEIIRRGLRRVEELQKIKEAT
jgi:predicted transcriptional regulator